MSALCTRRNDSGSTAVVVLHGVFSRSTLPKLALHWHVSVVGCLDPSWRGILGGGGVRCVGVLV